MLAIQLLFALSLGQPASAKTTVKALQRFNVSDAVCELKATGRDLPIPDEKITITCNRLTVLTEDLGHAEFLKLEIAGQNHPNLNAVRALVTFERGLTVTLVAYEISESQDKPRARIVYEHSSKTAAEAFEAGDVVFEHVGRRFVGDQILPQGTNVYWWRDEQYRFMEGFQWNESGLWSDRYCILYKPESCPAARVKMRILDEYEH